jgi:hypothetical protein
VETITLAQAIKSVALATKLEANINKLSVNAFDLWFEIGRAVYEGKFTVKALEVATETSCSVQVSKVRKVLKAMSNSKKFSALVSADAFTSLDKAYEASAKYVGKVKTSRKQTSKLDKAKTWAMTKTLAELNVLEQAIKAAKIAKRK